MSSSMTLNQLYDTSINCFPRAALEKLADPATKILFLKFWDENGACCWFVIAAVEAYGKGLVTWREEQNADGDEHAAIVKTLPGLTMEQLCAGIALWDKKGGLAKEQRLKLRERIRQYLNDHLVVSVAVAVEEREKDLVLV